MYGLRTEVASAFPRRPDRRLLGSGTSRDNDAALPDGLVTSTEGSPAMTDVEEVLDDAGIKNQQVREYVARWAAITQPDRIEVVSAEDDARLVQEALDAGELLPVGEGLYYSRSYAKDTAR